LKSEEEGGKRLSIIIINNM